MKLDETLGICGFGIVGEAFYEGFRDFCDVKIYDKYKQSDTLDSVCQNSSIIFICLPTPFNFSVGKIDLSIIDENIKKITKFTDNTDKIIVIKSTVVPGTTIEYQKKYPKTHFAFNPEFLRESTYIEDFKIPDRTIIGALNAQVALRLLGLYTKRFPGTKIFRTDPTTAEMVKYFANAMLGNIVIFNNVMFDICKALEISYEEVAKLVSEDRRFNTLKNYFEVTTMRGYGGKCLPKDINALIGRAKELDVDVSFIEKMWNENLRIRKIQDWEEIPWAITKEE